MPIKFLAFTCCFLITGQLTAQQGFSGSWKGALTGAAAGLEMRFHITETPDGFTCELEVPVQGLTGFPADKVDVRGDSIAIIYEVIGASFEGKLHTDSTYIAGVWHQSGLAFAIRLDPYDPAKGRPQDPQPPFPYLEDQVSFRSAGDTSVVLAGTLTYPRNKNAAAAVILVSGSGPQDRDEALMGHRPFLVLADYLSRKGIAVLRYDDRGVGESGGIFSEATTESFKLDAQGALTYLRSQDAVQVSRVGVIGHSEGGMVAAMLAAESLVDFAVLMAAPGLPSDEILIRQILVLNAVAGSDQQAVKQDTAYARKVYALLKSSPVDAPLDTAGMDKITRDYYDQSQALRQRFATYEGFRETQLAQVGSPWFRYFIKFEPARYLSRASCPVLILNGGKDTQVHGESNIEGIKRALINAPAIDVETRLFPGLNHLFQPAETGAISEYAQIETTIEPIVLETIATWIAKRSD